MTQTAQVAPARQLSAKTIADFAEDKLAPVHTLPLLRDALENLDGWRTAADALAVIERTNLGTISHGSDRDVITSLILEQAAAGDSDPVAILDASARATARDAAIPLANAALVHARRVLIGDMEAAIRGAWTELFGALDEQHTRMLDRARTIKSPGQLITADAAERAGRLADRGEWRNITAEHTALRDTQATLLETVSLDAAGLRPEAAYIRDIEQTFPQWLAWTTAGGTPDQFGVIEPIAPPWPLPRRRSSRQADGDLIGFDDRGRRDDTLTLDVVKAPAFLIWLTETDAHAWIPTPAELRAESARLDSLVADHIAAKVDPRDAGKYQTTEHTPGQYGNHRTVKA